VHAGGGVNFESCSARKERNILTDVANMSKFSFVNQSHPNQTGKKSCILRFAICSQCPSHKQDFLPHPYTLSQRDDGAAFLC
jgi:hypothetical protein